MMMIRRLKKLTEIDESNLTAQGSDELHNLLRFPQLVRKTTAWEISYNGKVIAYGGVINGSVISQGAHIWFIPSIHFLKHKYTAVKFFKRALKKLLSVYKRVYTVVDCAHTKAISFVLFLSFKKFNNAYGMHGAEYNLYEMRKEWL